MSQLLYWDKYFSRIEFSNTNTTEIINHIKMLPTVVEVKENREYIIKSDKVHISVYKDRVFLTAPNSQVQRYINEVICC